MANLGEATDDIKIGSAVSDITHKDFDYYCEVIIYGYCRPKFAQMHIPNDIIQLILFWYHPNTIILRCALNTGKTIGIMINPRDTVCDLKMRIQDREGIRPERFWLYLPSLGKRLSEHLRIYDYNLHTNDCIAIRLTLRATNQTNATASNIAVNAQNGASSMTTTLTTPSNVQGSLNPQQLWQLYQQAQQNQQARQQAQQQMVQAQQRQSQIQQQQLRQLQQQQHITGNTT